MSYLDNNTTQVHPATSPLHGLTAIRNKYVLNTGYSIPALGLGTWQTKSSEVELAVQWGDFGIRNLDKLLSAKLQGDLYTRFCLDTDPNVFRLPQP